MVGFPYLVLRYRHYGSFKLGLLYTSAALASAAAGLLFSFLADHWGRARTLLWVGLLLPISAAIVTISTQLPALFLACILGSYSATGSLTAGGAGGEVQPIQSAVIADLTLPANRTAYYSIFTFLAGIFGAVGSLLAKFSGVRGVFLAATIISGIGVLFLIPLRTRKIEGNLWRLRSKIVIGKFTVVSALNGFAQGMIAPFLIPFFVLVYHIPRSRMSIYAFAGGILASVAVLGAPRLDRHLGFVKSIAFTRGIASVLLIVLPYSGILFIALAIYIVYPALRVIALPAQRTALTDMVSPDELGRALGINQVARLGASSGGIALTGYMFEISDIAAPFYLHAAVMAVNICLYFRFFKSDREGPVVDGDIVE